VARVARVLAHPRFGIAGAARAAILGFAGAVLALLANGAIWQGAALSGHRIAGVAGVAFGAALAGRVMACAALVARVDAFPLVRIADLAATALDRLADAGGVIALAAIRAFLLAAVWICRVGGVALLAWSANRSGAGAAGKIAGEARWAIDLGATARGGIARSAGIRTTRLTYPVLAALAETAGRLAFAGGGIRLAASAQKRRRDSTGERGERIPPRERDSPSESIEPLSVHRAPPT
jgi:hypothetical protein